VSRQVQRVDLPLGGGGRQSGKEKWRQEGDLEIGSLEDLTRKREEEF